LAVNLIAHNQLLADLIPVLAAIDFVLGSVDR
jgi:NADH:ubiquinone oxidoreductase subunit D